MGAATTTIGAQTFARDQVPTRPGGGFPDASVAQVWQEKCSKLTCRPVAEGQDLLDFPLVSDSKLSVKLGSMSLFDQ
jgi:hypothetical protein